MPIRLQNWGSTSSIWHLVGNKARGYLKPKWVGWMWYAVGVSRKRELVGEDVLK